MRQNEFYRALSRSREEESRALTAVTVLEGSRAGEKFLFAGKEPDPDSFGSAVFLERLGRKPELLICGAGHVSMPVIDLGKMLGFAVTVLEDRPRFADQARKKGADRVICLPFQEGLAQVELTEDTYAVIVTRGHRYDETCLYEILSREMKSGRNCAYTGMMGSRRRTAIVRRKMEELGLEKQLIDRVYAPIGLAIRAETPEEIAVSVFAQIIQVKNEKKRTEGYPEELTEAILACMEKQEKAVLATIIERKGSAPRSVGTKMLIREDGASLGTIGGGCAESRVLQKAFCMMRVPEQPAFTVCEVDMTAQEAEEEGMVCGGRIRVMLEALVP